MFSGGGKQGGLPAISSGVYIIEPRARIIMNMYDDRGLDVIATKLDALRPMFKRFGEGISENRRHTIEFRFDSSSQAQPE
jgi:hypothetical protein